MNTAHQPSKLQETIRTVISHPESTQECRDTFEQQVDELLALSAEDVVNKLARHRNQFKEMIDFILLDRHTDPSRNSEPTSYDEALRKLRNLIQQIAHKDANSELQLAKSEFLKRELFDEQQIKLEKILQQDGTVPRNTQLADRPLANFITEEEQETAQAFLERQLTKELQIFRSRIVGKQLILFDELLSDSFPNGRFFALELAAHCLSNDDLHPSYTLKALTRLYRQSRDDQVSRQVAYNLKTILEPKPIILECLEHTNDPAELRALRYFVENRGDRTIRERYIQKMEPHLDCGENVFNYALIAIKLYDENAMLRAALAIEGLPADNTYKTHKLVQLYYDLKQKIQKQSRAS